MTTETETQTETPAYEITADDIRSRMLALGRERLIAEAHLTEAEAQRLGLEDGDLVWGAICEGDGQVWPRGQVEHVAKLLGVDVDQIADDAMETDTWLRGAPSVIADGGWDYLSPDCECGRHWDMDGERPECAPTPTCDRTYEITQIDQLDLGEVVVPDLRAEIDDDDGLDGAIEAYRVTIRDRAERITVLWYPEIGRAGIASGSDSDWTDASSVEDAINRLYTDRLVP